MTRVKICGLHNTDDAMAAARGGADFLGMVFEPTRRQVSEEKAREIVSTVRTLDHPPAFVGVFANEIFENVNRIAATCGLDWVQLSGDEPYDYCRKIIRPVIKVVHVLEQSEYPDMLKELNDTCLALHDKRMIILLDSKVPNSYGGTGIAFDWTLAKRVAERFPVFIAGGLTPSNVDELVREVHPRGVDVSSGVETNSQKDIAKITAFIRNAKKPAN